MQEYKRARHLKLSGKITARGKIVQPKYGHVTNIRTYIHMNECTQKINYFNVRLYIGKINYSKNMYIPAKIQKPKGEQTKIMEDH